MRRVVILGRGAAGKSTLARRLGELTGLPVIELDTVFWSADLTPMPRAEWAAAQRELTTRAEWIMDGDLGPYDVLDVRLRAADTVLLLDLPFVLCAWRALRRSRERAGFWRWLIGYRRAPLLRAIRTHAPGAELHVLTSPGAVRRFTVRASWRHRR